MPARLATILELFRASLWFIPGMMALAAVLIAWAALAATGLLPDRDAVLWTWHTGTGKDAATLMAALLTALITMASLAVSIMMVVLTLAAGQLGPRLIRSFMADRRTQVAIGFFLAGIVYLVLVRRALREDMPADTVPHLPVTIGSLILLLCIGVLLLFTHHLARSIVADTVIARVGDDLDATIARLTSVDPDGEVTPDEHLPAATAPMEAWISLPLGGYVQTIAYDALASAAHEADCRIELAFRPGHHLLPGGKHVRIVAPPGGLDELTTAIADCISVGADRTAHQDPEYSIRQLVEVALRALSPGINDPYTAIVAIDRLGESLSLAMRRQPVPHCWRDEGGNVRLTAPTSTFAGMVDESFSQIRQSAEGHPAVLIHMADTLGLLGEVARHDRHRAPLARHLRLIVMAGQRSIPEPEDAAEVQARVNEAFARLDAPDRRAMS